MSSIIWINGATSPSGNLLAQYYSENNYKIILSADSRDELYALKAKCKGNPMNIHILSVDMQKPEDMLDRAKEALRIFGRIDTLILCSSFELNKTASETHLAEGKELMDRNYWSNIALNKAVLPIMKRQGKGHVLVFNPLEAKIGLADRSAFSASRHALYGYFDSLRLEIDTEINITLVVGELEARKDSIAKFIKDINKYPEDLVLDKQQRKLLKLRALRPKAFFKKMKKSRDILVQKNSQPDTSVR